MNMRTSYVLLAAVFVISRGATFAQPTIDGNLSDVQYNTLATKLNSNAGFGGNIDVSKIVFYADGANQQFYLGVVGKLEDGNSNGIGIMLNFSETTGASAGTALGGSPGGHFMGGNGGSNVNFKVDFEVDYMFAMNAGGPPNGQCYLDAVKLVGPRQASYLGNCAQAGSPISGPSGASDFFAQNSVTFAFNNGGGANQGFEMKVPFSQLGVTSVGTVQAFAFIVSSSAYFSDVTVPGNVTSGNSGFDVNYFANLTSPGCSCPNPNSTIGSGPYHGPAAPLPIQLSSFTARQLSQTSVRLDWTTASEINNYGFYVQRKAANADQWTEVSSGFIAGSGTSSTPRSYSFVDNSVTSGTWSYRLKQQDMDGSIHYTEPVQVRVLTGVVEAAPREFTLSQNYPNPFNPSTEIKFSVENSARSNLTVYNLLGQRVATLFDDFAEAGRYYRVPFDASSLSSGMYLYKLESGTKSSLKKLLLMK